ncbi:hypothetical protein Scep_028332 [Stephania cephalantha]|uniref:Uncharacterized protein n=1 Tax=Stephania cephalantha TaxID=152367 RepID=A0AAP0HND3_9MAGN
MLNHPTQLWIRGCHNLTSVNVRGLSSLKSTNTDPTSAHNYSLSSIAPTCISVHVAAGLLGDVVESDSDQHFEASVYNLVEPTWEVSLFFVVHRVCTALEVVVKRSELGEKWRLYRVVYGF